MIDPRLPLTERPSPSRPSVDLHSHTDLSDGLLAPEALVALAAAAGVDVLAVTDHDTTAGVPAAMAAARARGLRLIPGMEISAHHGRRSLHLLAFFGPGALERLGPWQEARRRARRERLEEILARLDALGLAVDREAVFAGLGPQQSAGRPHVARALEAAGHVADFPQAFERWLGTGKPAYVPDRGPSAAEAIALVHALPGLAVVAHPVHDDLDAVLEELQALGLDGVEAYHGSHAPEVAAHFHRRARELDLLVTGGSDFHGGEPDDPTAGARRPGGVALPPDEWARFEAALRAAAGEDAP